MYETDIVFTSHLDVELIQSVGTDEMIASAARVSTGHDEGVYTEKADAGLIRYLVKKKHGSPFEHTSMTFRVEAPIFVFREFMRHRVGFSYNEVSGRYKKLDPKFYVYPSERPLFQEGSSAHPDLQHGTQEESVVTNMMVNGTIKHLCSKAWQAYEGMLGDYYHPSVANEVARAVLPVNIYSSMYVTCNARSLMNFLMLRVDSPENTFETKPQWEIQKVAEQMEAIFAEVFPVTYAEFIQNGRVAP